MSTRGGHSIGQYLRYCVIVQQLGFPVGGSDVDDDDLFQRDGRVICSESSRPEHLCERFIVMPCHHCELVGGNFIGRHDLQVRPNRRYRLF